ncbi:MAG: hypothetical protein IPJ98_21315 [Bryobacterales bacterium]|nr:hypothetical protein [Bryobacterales bacterium]
MDILGDRKYVELPGETVHELPPLLVHEQPPVRRLDKVVDMATNLIEKEDLVPSYALDAVVGEAESGRRKMDMALNLVDRYLRIAHHWQWGDDVLEWIRQCEITFESKPNLRALLRPDVWPHAGRASFVTLLEDKAVPAREGVDLEKAVGLRLTFRRRPQLDVFSDQFLFYLDATVANSAYHTWASMSHAPAGDLPPERFQVNVLKM